MTKLDQIRAAEERLLLQTYERNPILFVGGEGVHLIDENGTKYLDLLERHRRQRARLRAPGDRGGYCSPEPRADPHFEPLLSRGPGRARASPHRAHRPRSRLLRQHRHRSMGGRTETGARSCGPAAQRRQDDRHQVSRARAKLPWPHLWFHVDYVQGQVPRAFWPCRAGRRVCALQRCCRSARKIFE